MNAFDYFNVIIPLEFLKREEDAIEVNEWRLVGWLVLGNILYVETSTTMFLKCVLCAWFVYFSACSANSN